MIKKQKYILDFVTGICIPEIEMNLEMMTVGVGVRALRATWTPELVQDIGAYHNIDAEAELTALLSEHVAAEIDREIIRDLQNVRQQPDPIQPTRGNLLTINQVGDRNRQQEIRQQTVSRWDNLGFLDGLEGHVRENIATLYEGHAATLINETPPQPGGFEEVAFPLVRRVHTQLLANDIVSVQQMELPLSELVYFTPNYLEEQEEYEVNWRTHDTWEYDGLYGSKIGITMNMLKHEFIPKYKSVFELAQFPNRNRFR